MKTKLTILTLIATITLARATLITVDLGPSRHRVDLNPEQEFIASFTPPVSDLSGQTLSLDFNFTGNRFIHIYPQTSRIFDIGADLILFGDGSIHAAPFSAYTVGVDGIRNSPVWSNTFTGIIGTTSEPEIIGLSIGGLFPLLNDTTHKELLISGLHVDLTLPVSDFRVVGGDFVLSPDGGKPWSNLFGIGPNVPDSGSTVALMGVALAVIIFLGRRIHVYD
jgi:hypothetical protein